MKQKIIKEYEAVKNLKGTLNIFKIDTSIDVPVRVRRRDDFTSDSSLPSNSLEINDPQVWPPPVETNLTLRFAYKKRLRFTT